MLEEKAVSDINLIFIRLMSDVSLWPFPSCWVTRHHALCTCMSAKGLTSLRPNRFLATYYPVLDKLTYECGRRSIRIKTVWWTTLIR